MSVAQDWVPSVEDETGSGDQDQPQETPQEIEARVRAELLEQHQQNISRRDRKMNQFLNRLRDAGLDRGEDGESLVIRDPRIVASKLMGLDAVAQAQQEPEAIPDPTYQQPEFAAWQKRQAAEEAKQAVDPIQKRLAASEAMVARFAVGAAVENAKPILERLQMAHAAEDPRFRSLMAEALQMAKVPLDRWDSTDPEILSVIQTAATYALPTYIRILDEGGETPEATTNGNGTTKRALTAVERANRASIQQISSTRGEGGAPSGFTQDEIDGAEAMSQMLKRTVTPEEFRASGDVDGRALRSYNAEQARKQRAANRR